METTDLTWWWHCPGCSVDAELDAEMGGALAEPAAQPCPECGEPMLERLPWGVAA